MLSVIAPTGFSRLLAATGASGALKDAGGPPFSRIARLVLLCSTPTSPSPADPSQIRLHGAPLGGDRALQVVKECYPFVLGTSAHRRAHVSELRTNAGHRLASVPALPRQVIHEIIAIFAECQDFSRQIFHVVG